jgi:hypothetical protein
MTPAIEELNSASTCECISCPACKGNGFIWISLSGEYLGANRSDDLDEMAGCDECRGTGVDGYCDKCMDQIEIDRDRQEY